MQIVLADFYILYLFFCFLPLLCFFVGCEIASGLKKKDEKIVVFPLKRYTAFVLVSTRDVAKLNNHQAFAANIYIPALAYIHNLKNLNLFSIRIFLVRVLIDFATRNFRIEFNIVLYTVQCKHWPRIFVRLIIAYVCCLFSPSQHTFRLQLVISSSLSPAHNEGVT